MRCVSVPLTMECPCSSTEATSLMSDDLALPHTAEITAKREVLYGWGIVLQDSVNPISQLKWYSSTSPVDKPSELIFQQVEYKWPHLPSCKVAQLGNLCFLVQQLYALKGTVNVPLSLQPCHFVHLMPRDPEARKGVSILAGVIDLDHVKGWRYIKWQQRTSLIPGDSRGRL